jgi:hypothetical protein
LLLSTPASALSEWRSQVQVSVGSGVGTQFAFDGGLNAPSASQTLSNGSGTGTASSSLSPDGYIPTLRVRATDAGTRAQAVAWGVQGYTNTSGEVLFTSLIMNLTANITGSNDLSASVYLFEDENFEFAILPGTILFESSSQLWPGFETFANNLGPTGFDIQIKDTAGPVDEVRQFDFSVDPGDSFYVWTWMLGTADVTGEVDAFNTLTASFTNTAGLTPAAVPAPAIPWLLGWSTAGLALTARRRGQSGH